MVDLDEVVNRVYKNLAFEIGVLSHEFPESLRFDCRKHAVGFGSGCSETFSIGYNVGEREDGP